MSIFIFTSTLLFSKPRRKKKRFKEEVEADKQTIFILILTHNQKLKFEISNKIDAATADGKVMQLFLIENPLISSYLSMIHGHPTFFRSLQNFIQQFLKEKSSFITKKLSDQSTNNRLMNQHQIEK
jgi:hypothetical protein